MKILVVVNREVDYRAAVRPRADASGVDTDPLPKSMNPYDEVATEQAVRLREAGLATEVVAVECGNDDSADVLLTALAMGADRAIHIRSRQVAAPLYLARLLQYVVAREAPRLVLLGRLRLDDSTSHLAPMLAALLKCAQATSVSAIQIQSDRAVVTRDIDTGQQVDSILMPAVVSVDLHLNQPRYVSLPSAKKAKSKPLLRLQASELGVESRSQISSLKFGEPPQRKPCTHLSSCGELLEVLRRECNAI